MGLKDTDAACTTPIIIIVDEIPHRMTRNLSYYSESQACAMLSTITAFVMYKR